MKTRFLGLLFVAAVFTAGTFNTSAQGQTLNELCTAAEWQDFVKGFERYAQHGNTHSMVFLALAYANGEVVEQDHRKASMWIRESVRLRSPLGAYVKAQWLRQGFVFEQDEERAEWLIDRAIAGGFAVAMYDRAVRLLHDPERMQEGADLLEEAADLGLPNARYLFALLLEHGEVYEQDLVTAGASINASVRDRFQQKPTGTRMRRARPCEETVGCRVVFSRDSGDVPFTTLAGALGLPNGM